MRELLEEQCFFAEKGFVNQGFALGVDSGTALAEIDYRSHPVYPTAKEAVEATVAERVLGVAREHGRVT